MPSNDHYYDYCKSGHVHWTSYSRCHVYRWLHQHGTKCMDLGGGATDQVRMTWELRLHLILSLRSWRIRQVNRLGFVFTEYVVHLLRGRLQDQEPLCRDPEIQLSERLLLGGPGLRAMVRHGDRRFRPPCQVCLSSVCNLHSSSCFSRVPHLTNLESKLVWRFMIE